MPTGFAISRINGLDRKAELVLGGSIIQIPLFGVSEIHPELGSIAPPCVSFHGVAGALKPEPYSKRISLLGWHGYTHAAAFSQLPVSHEFFQAREFGSVLRTNINLALTVIVRHARSNHADWKLAGVETENEPGDRKGLRKVEILDGEFKGKQGFVTVTLLTKPKA